MVPFNSITLAWAARLDHKEAAKERQAQPDQRQAKGQSRAVWVNLPKAV
jgi:hypothetical protein